MTSFLRLTAGNLTQFPLSVATRGLAILGLLFVDCSSHHPSSLPKPTLRRPTAERWQCTNDVEVQCLDGACESTPNGDFTPMSIQFDDAGNLSVCAYSGCWEGTGHALRSSSLLLVVGDDLRFSTSMSPGSTQDIAIVLDRVDRIATIKAGPFAQPLRCERLVNAD